jgi:hypothetical protein
MRVIDSRKLGRALLRMCTGKSLLLANTDLPSPPVLGSRAAAFAR